MQHQCSCSFLQNPIPANKSGLPVNITTLVNFNTNAENRINVSWKNDGNNYAIAAYLVKKLTSAVLLQRLETQCLRHSNFTRDCSKYTEFVSFQVSGVDVAKLIVFPHMEHK